MVHFNGATAADSTADQRGGVKRTSGIIYEESRGALKVFLEGVLKNAVTYAAYDRRSARVLSVHRWYAEMIGIAGKR